jgi:hypothetical protein
LSQSKLSNVRLEIAIDILSMPEQSELGAALVRGCAEDPHVKRILAFYGVKV